MPPTSRRPGRTEFVGLAVVMAAAAALRAVVLEQQPLWYDEIAVLYRASAPDLPGLVARLAGDVQAPLHDLLMLPLVATFGDGPWVARLPALVASVLLVPVLAALVRELGGGRGAQVTGALWAALDPYLVRYGVEGRPYALLALLGGGLSLAALRCVRRDGRGAWTLAAWGAPLAMVHPYGVPLLGAVGLWLALNGAALSSRAGAVLGALLVPVLTLLAWSPLALHQLATKSMDAIYAGLDLPQLLSVLDGVTLAAPRGTGANSQTALVMAGRALTLALMLAGWARCRAARAPAADVTDGVTAGAARRPALSGALLVLLGLGALAVGTLVPEQGLADLASRLGKGGRPLDEQNLAFLASLRGFARLAGGGLVLAGALLLTTPRWSVRWGGRASPAVLALLVIGVTLGLAGVMGALGHPTFAPRNAIGVQPLAVALVALGIWRLPRAARAALALVLVAQLVWGLGALDSFHRRRAWPELSAALAASEATPLAYPPWLARCVEYHGDLPWGSVAGMHRPADVRAWVMGQRAVGLVSGYTEIADPAPIRAAVSALMQPGEVLVVRGLTLELFETP